MKRTDLQMNKVCLHLSKVFLLTMLMISCRDVQPPVTSSDEEAIKKYEAKFLEYEFNDPDSAFYYLEVRKALADRLNDEEIIWQALYDLGSFLFNQGRYAEALDYQNETNEMAGRMQDTVKLYKVLNALGNIQHKISNYPAALDYFYRSLQMRESLGKHASTSIPLTNIGLVYKDLKEYDKAKEAFEKCIAIDSQYQDTFGLALDYNHIGIAFRHKKKHAEARKSFYRSLALSEQLNDDLQKSIVFNNLGLVESDEGNYEEAVKYLKSALDIKRRLGLEFEITISLNFLAEVYLKRGDARNALRTGEEALVLASGVGARDQISLALQNMSGAYEQQGNVDKAFTLFKEFKVYQDSLISESRTRQISEMEALYEKDKKEKQIASLTISNQQKELRQNRYLAGLVFAVLIGTIVIAALRYRMKKNRQLTEAKIRSYESELQHFTQNVLDKNKRIEELNSALELTKIEISAACPSQTVKMDRLMQSTILTQEEWIEFKRLFNQVYPGFLTSVRLTYKDLTETEERLMVLAKLNLHTKEMAAMLGISSDSVNKSRYRLRKKLNINVEEFGELVESF